ncbi:MAG: type II toxin-antitoxin system RelE/ParE family toxin [Burkholderiales bacterium]|nr:type II toxin-antitoxin system RelE/ParE family toxin [Phycisphaerae bacterium]
MQPSFRLIIANKAATDLERIFAYIRNDSPTQAAAMVERILSGVESLKVLPHRTIVQGQPTSAKPPIRSLPIGSYIVFFRVMDEESVVRILRVRHGSRRSLKRF